MMVKVSQRTSGNVVGIWNMNSSYLNLLETAFLNTELMKMASFELAITLFFPLFLRFVASNEDGFIFNGFRGVNLSIDGIASIVPNGLLQLTNATRQRKGHAFYPHPLHFKSPFGKVHSFSSTFVFAIISEYSDLSGNGMAFLISPSTDFSTALPNQYLGLFNQTSNGNSTNHILAIEFDTIQNPEFDDIDNNHVGIDVDSLKSITSHTAGYYADDSGLFQNLNLIGRQAMQVWVDYEGEDMQLNVTMSPIKMPKPNRPLLSSTVNLSTLIFDSMYIGFSSATGSFITSHCVLGWSFKINGKAESLDYTRLPPLPHFKNSGNSKILKAWLPLVSCFFLLLILATITFFVRRRIKYAELLEDWEKEYGPHRFSYKDLYRATNGFKDKELLGIGGFGRVYRGVLPVSNIEVAVKRVSHDSRQGMKEFVAEIVSIGQLRHRNIVQLLGYCRLKGELLLVYDFMPNGSLDKFLHFKDKPTLYWAQRFGIVKGVASALLYLHEDWEQVVLHRDVKASNVLLDSEMNGRLGDFGLARLYDHGTDPETTNVVGTMGYLAPELAIVGKGTTKTDVFAFGAFLLEVTCGRRPVEHEAKGEESVLADWVLENWKTGSLLRTRDPRLVEEKSLLEMEKVLKLGLLCCHPTPEARPSMRQVMQFLDEDVILPELSPAYMSFDILSMIPNEGVGDYHTSLPSSVATMSVSSFSGGR